MDGWIVRCVGGWVVGGCIDDVWVDGQMDGWMVVGLDWYKR